MRRKKDKDITKSEFKNVLMRRLKLLENSRQHYQQNPNLMSNVRIANIGIIQNEIEYLRQLLSMITEDTTL